VVLAQRWPKFGTTGPPAVRGENALLLAVLITFLSLKSRLFLMLE